MQGGLCHERSASMQEGQAGFEACSTSYSDAHGSLQSNQGTLDSVTVAVQGPIDPYRFNMFMSDLLAERGSDIKQMHGILTIQGASPAVHPYIVTRTVSLHTKGYGSHGTHFKFEGAQQTVRFGPTVGAATDSQVTFSGHQLCAKDLQEALDSCTWLPVAPGWTEHSAPGILQPFYFHQATGRKQWQRPAAVESEPTTPSRCQLQSSVALASQAVAAQLSMPSPCGQDRLLHSRTKQKRSRSPARSAVSCPCDASHACAAVFDIKCKEDLRCAKRMRDEDVTSRLADIDIKSDMRGSGTSSAIIDSASELEAARIGQGKMQNRKISAHTHFRHSKEQVKGSSSLRRSSSCPWTPEQTEKLTALQC